MEEKEEKKKFCLPLINYIHCVVEVAKCHALKTLQSFKVETKNMRLYCRY